MAQDDLTLQHRPVKIFGVADEFVAIIADDTDHVSVKIVVGKVAQWAEYSN